MKWVLRNEVGTRHVIEPDPEDVKTRVWVERDPPLQVYCDYEATMDDEGVQTPILLGAESNEEDHTEFYYGPDCTKSFFEWLESLAVDQEGDDRSVIAVFHNLKGYDGMFLLQHCNTKDPCLLLRCMILMACQLRRRQNLSGGMQRRSESTTSSSRNESLL